MEHEILKQQTGRDERCAQHHKYYRQGGRRLALGLFLQAERLGEIGLNLGLGLLGLALAYRAGTQRRPAAVTPLGGLIVPLGRGVYIVSHALQAAERLLADDLSALCNLGFEPLALLFCRLKLGGHILALPRRVHKLGQQLLFVRKLVLKLRQTPIAVEAALALPLTQTLVGLGVGAVLLAGGDNGADALFKLGTVRHRNLALLDKRTAAENIAAHARERFACVRAGKSVNGDICSRIHRGKFAHRSGGRFRRAHDGDIAAFFFYFHAALHGCSRPRGIAHFIGQKARLLSLGAVNTVEHGADKSTPCALAALVRG